MSLNFNKVWASDTSPDYPTDTQAKRGLSFLGTEAPTFDLHDAIFQRADNKALWLYDQVRIACERFGQKVQGDDGSLVNDARDIMANAITYALLNQRKADEGGYGIVRMADYYQTREGKEYNLAVSPAHLAEYVEAQNTWENIKDKPQTATRWPDYREVTNSPTFGSAAWRNTEDFDPAGAASEALEKAVSRDSSRRCGFIASDQLNPYIEHFDGKTGTIIPIARSASVESIKNSLKAGAFMTSSPGTSVFSLAGKNDESTTTLQTVELRDYCRDHFLPRDAAIAAGFAGGDVTKPYIQHNDKTVVDLARKNWVSDQFSSLGAGAKMSSSGASVFSLSGSKTEATTTLQTVELRDYSRDHYLARDAAIAGGFAEGNVTKPYFRHNDNTLVELQRKLVISQSGRSGSIIYPDGFCEQWGEFAVGNPAGSYTTYQITFPISFSEVGGFIPVADCVAFGACSRRDVTNSRGIVSLAKLTSDATQFTITWRAWGKINV